MSKTEFNVPTREEVSPANQEVFDKLKGGLGFVPNIYATMAYSKNGLSRYLDFQNAKSSLSTKEKEAVNLISSQINGCLYCQSAHVAIGKMNGFNDEQIAGLRNGRSDDKKLNALVKLAADLTKNRGSAAPETVTEFLEQGYTKENLVDVVLQVSEISATNYLHNLTKVPIDFPAAPAL